ncbi:MAG: 50S ribosomal protein L25 [Chloroflexaceae bacterium]|nr:50S ribosomal protein L25 [Chloroflexaceae bacterium]
METISLDARVRQVVGKKVKDIRKAGRVPAVVYGKDVDPVSIEVDDKTFTTLYRQHGLKMVIDLNIDGHLPQTTLVHAIQRHPVTRSIMHIDFLVVKQKPWIRLKGDIYSDTTSMHL